MNLTFEIIINTDSPCPFRYKYRKMNAEDIRSMFVGIDDDTKEIIARKLKKELSESITSINKKLLINNQTLSQLSPQPKDIFNAFRNCPLYSTRVVILGQDPYIKQFESMGMSFSVPIGTKIPPSLLNIYKCLLYHNLIREMPIHGDLTNWAKQGVLLINTALTTVLKKSNEHSVDWTKYTDLLLREISNLPTPIIFIMLGGFAQGKSKFIDKRRHIVLEWGHPSPLNGDNQGDGPKNFKYCTAFVRANDFLIGRGLAPINWNPSSGEIPQVVRLADFVNIKEPIVDPLVIEAKQPIYKIGDANDEDPAVLTNSTLWIFTDGGSSGNGKAHCSSSWGFYITDGCTVASGYGIVEEVNIPGEVYKSSNNRGELSAIAKALEFAVVNKLAAPGTQKFDYNRIMIVSDSEYSINCLDKWAKQWINNPVKSKLSEKKNLDIIIPAVENLDRLRIATGVTFKHVNSHVKEPTDPDSEGWFMWKCNDMVDKLCNVALGRTVKK